MNGKKARLDHIAESALLAPIKRLFPQHQYVVRSEVPFNGKSIDVLAMDRKTRRLIAIELKVRKWRKALRQAAVYQLCANRVYVALWHKHVNPENLELISSYGLGVIEIAPNRRANLRAKIVCQPKRRALLNRNYARELRKRLA